MNDAIEQSFSDLVIERVRFGIFVLDRSMSVLVWNRLQDRSRLAAEHVAGQSVFVNFFELSRAWLAFSTWEQRSDLFKFDHDRPITPFLRD
jgi:hypothetical protein